MQQSWRATGHICDLEHTRTLLMALLPDFAAKIYDLGEKQSST